MVRTLADETVGQTIVVASTVEVDASVEVDDSVEVDASVEVETPTVSLVCLVKYISGSTSPGACKIVGVE
jgi:hypothetical protein